VGASMNTAEVALRAVTYVAAMLMFGASLFVIYARGGARAPAEEDLRRQWNALRRRIRQLQLGCIVATLVAGLLWLVIHSAAVAGIPALEAVSGAAAGEVLRETLFGRAMAWHLGLGVVLAVMLVLDRRVVETRSSLRSDVIRVVLSAAILASLGWMGHAAATRGFDRYVHLGGDVAHLLAAGAWLGALPLLAVLLVGAARRQSPSFDRVALLATRRFSAIGVLCVGALLVTGVVNAWYLVATPPALFGTAYGQLLLLKLALFAGMLILAARNRFVLTPRIQEAVSRGADAGRIGMRSIARNAWGEAALGLGVVAIVGALGIAVPGAHAEIVWPLPFTLDVDSFAVARAHPTTYARAPVRYATATVAAGATLYRANCEACHGVDARGDGPAAASLPVRPPNLTSGHAIHHRPGDLYWWIAHGIPETPMPAFEGRLTDEQIWQVMTFVHAETDAREARALTNRVANRRPIAAPDFPFETAGGDQETLAEQRSSHAVLLVLYAYPESRERLIALAAARTTLERAGVRVIAIPIDAKTPIASNAEGVDATMLAVCDPSVAAVYSRFLPKPSGAREGAPAQHAELLVDRAGYVRSISIGVAAAPGNRVAELLQDADRLAREPPEPVSRMHMH
ncbi:MAG TPA: copper homeostasis membrane protein CopD, partial [Casimicrobiaceae bacterium]|nr:copper homeostasis membrane protein CopD [Casimicrobiaceae bacterium]